MRRCISRLSSTVDTGEIRFLMEGLVVETVPLPQFCKGVVVLVTHERFQRDISAGTLIRDTAFEAATLEAEKAAKQILKPVDYRKTEMYVFEGARGESTKKPIRVVDGACFDNDRVTPFMLPESIIAPGLYLSSVLDAAESASRRFKWITRPLAGVAAVFLLLLFVGLVSASFDNGSAPVFLVLFGGLLYGMIRLLTTHLAANDRHSIRLQTNIFPVAEAMERLGLDATTVAAITDVRPEMDENRPLRVVGEVAAKSDDPTHDPEVLTDLWACTGDTAIRIVSSRPFSLRVDGRRRVRVTVDPARGAWIEGTYRKGSGAPFIAPFMQDFIEQKLSAFLLNRDNTKASGRGDALGETDGLYEMLSIGEGVALLEGDTVALIAPPGTWTCVGRRSLCLKLTGREEMPLLIRIISSSTSDAGG